MSMDYLARLVAAQSVQERTWIVTESLLETLPADLRSMVWAAAIPHWFDENILAALRPELAEHAARLYAELQTLSFVEVFQGRGFNLHELTRKALLEHLWNENQDEFRALSQRAADYFTQDETTERRIESIYHRVIANPKDGAQEFWEQGAEWNDSFNYAELNALSESVLEHVRERELTGRAKGLAFFFRGLEEQRVYHQAEALGALQEALQNVESDSQLRANALKATGDVLQFLDKRDEALARYDEALQLFRAVGSRLGEANALSATGDVLQFLKKNDEALARYDEALHLFRAVGDRLGEANTLAAQGQLFLRDNGERADELLAQAIDLFTQIGDRYSVPAQIGNYGWALLRLNQAERAQPYFARAAEQFEQIGMKEFAVQCRAMVQNIQAAMVLAHANSLSDKKDYAQAVIEYQRVVEIMPSIEAWNGLGNTLESLERYDEAFDAYSHALALELDAPYLIRNRANVLLNLNRLEEAERDIARAVELDADNFYTHARQGELALRRGEFEAAATHYEYAVAHDEDVGWKFGLALAKYGAGDKAQAKTMVEDALKQASDDDKSQREWFERVAQVRPELADAARDLGLA